MAIIIEGSTIEEIVEKAKAIQEAMEPDTRWQLTMQPIFASQYRCFHRTKVVEQGERVFLYRPEEPPAEPIKINSKCKDKGIKG